MLRLSEWGPQYIVYKFTGLQFPGRIWYLHTVKNILNMKYHFFPLTGMVTKITGMVTKVMRMIAKIFKEQVLSILKYFLIVSLVNTNLFILAWFWRKLIRELVKNNWELVYIFISSQGMVMRFWPIIPWNMINYKIIKWTLSYDVIKCDVKFKYIMTVSAFELTC